MQQQRWSVGFLLLQVLVQRSELAGGGRRTGGGEWRRCHQDKSLSNIQKHSLAANQRAGRPWAADRYLPSDLADGDFHSTASFSCTNASLAGKELRSLFYGSSKTTHPSPSPSPLGSPFQAGWLGFGLVK